MTKDTDDKNTTGEFDDAAKETAQNGAEHGHIRFGTSSFARAVEGSEDAQVALRAFLLRH